jgi:hypothetical protein
MTPAFVQGLRDAKRRHHPRGALQEKTFLSEFDRRALFRLWIRNFRALDPIRGFLIISKTPNTHPLQ